MCRVLWLFQRSPTFKIDPVFCKFNDDISNFMLYQRILTYRRNNTHINIIYIYPTWFISFCCSSQSDCHYGRLPKNRSPFTFRSVIAFVCSDSYKIQEVNISLAISMMCTKYLMLKYQKILYIIQRVSVN